MRRNEEEPDIEALENYSRYAAQIRLRRYWEVYQRANDTPVTFDGKADRLELIAWAIMRGFEPAWFGWALDSKYLEMHIEIPDDVEDSETIKDLVVDVHSHGGNGTRTESNDTPNCVDKIARTNRRNEEKKHEISDLRARAGKIAVKLKRDGIHPKHITVARVCKDLLKESFASGKPFASRWRSVRKLPRKVDQS